MSIKGNYQSLVGENFVNQWVLLAMVTHIFHFEGFG